jgi:hypothetical protein
MRFIKVSTRKYEARNQENTVLFTIKRITSTRYIVRPFDACPETSFMFQSLVEAKEYIRNHSSMKRKGWISFFTRHTRGLSFKSKEESNRHMKELATRWKNEK